MTTMSENVSATGLNNSKYHLNKVWNNFVKEIRFNMSAVTALKTHYYKERKQLYVSDPNYVQIFGREKIHQILAELRCVV